MLVCAFYWFLDARPRVQQAPGVPCALFFGGRNDLQGPGERCRGNAEGWFVVIASAAKQSTLPLRGDMDCFAALAMTGLAGDGWTARARPTEYTACSGY